jgi:hypothetical protein
MRPYKYAMPMDPRVLEQDYESEGLDTLNEIVAKLKSIKEPNEIYSKLSEEIGNSLEELFYYVDSRNGISLRDREKLLPIFKEYARLSKNYRSSISTLYRGVYLPTSIGFPLTEEYGEDADGWVPLKRGSHVRKTLEGLAYGLRSWATDKYLADNYRRNPYGYSDSVMFRLLSYKPSSFIVEGDAVKRMDVANNMSLRTFDSSECILFLKNPKIVNVIRDRENDVWNVLVKE